MIPKTKTHRLLHYGRDSPLRPEMAESALALHRATGSTKYLRAGQDMLRALQENSRVACGFASVGDVGTGEMDDRMDSFFIAETLKYLFLLFDGCVFVVGGFAAATNIHMYKRCPPSCRCLEFFEGGLLCFATTRRT